MAAPQSGLVQSIVTVQPSQNGKGRILQPPAPPSAGYGLLRAWKSLDRPINGGGGGVGGGAAASASAAPQWKVLETHFFAIPTTHIHQRTRVRPVLPTWFSTPFQPLFMSKEPGNQHSLKGPRHVQWQELKLELLHWGYDPSLSNRGRYPPHYLGTLLRFAAYPGQPPLHQHSEARGAACTECGHNWDWSSSPRGTSTITAMGDVCSGHGTDQIQHR